MDGQIREVFQAFQTRDSNCLEISKKYSRVLAIAERLLATISFLCVASAVKRGSKESK